MHQEQQNPFDDESLVFSVLMNERRQYSLWPVFAALPTGWERIFGPQSRASCIEYIENHWLDMRPADLKTISVTER
ncbi:MbtH family protein [Brenneria uluponensis]|uniref:MbtH family protein n=1 Tax=Brenneria uluponensis TaxID=3057057 RepID=UPI0028EF7110|nr:MbtH family NRPS accessory protein [Brenneria ulupoensis]